jgi:hypothetical protein
MKYNSKNMDVVSGLWNQNRDSSMVCPECGGKLILIQIEPIYDMENLYTPYDTVLECTSCSFNIRAQSFTILGSVKEFNLDKIEIASWSPSGSRTISNFEHVLDYNALKNLKASGDLVEFLVVNNHVIQIIA